MWHAASRPCARMFEQRLRGHGLWQPLPAPHTRTAYCTLHRVGRWPHPGESSEDGWRHGSMQDGEGWTPRSSDQSVLVLSPIYYRPLASEELTSPAIERACLKGAGMKAFKGVARLTSFCRATAATDDSVRARVRSARPRTNDHVARPNRGRPSRSMCRREAVSKVCGS